MLAGYLEAAGAGEVRLAPIAGKHDTADEAVAVLESADVVFVSGGDVEAGMRALESRGMPPHLVRLYGSGRLFIGISAGSIMLARSWIRWGDSDDDGTAEAFPCLGCAPILCDTHGEGEAWEELKAMLRLTGAGSEGYGISAGAALRIDLGGEIQALGAPVARLRYAGGKIVELAPLVP